VPIVTISMLHIPVARSGAALSGVRSPWANLSGAGANNALAQIPGSAVVAPRTRFAASRRIPAMAQPLAVMAAGLPLDTRKQYVHKTRVNAGGDGASGPHRGREPA
jgi:hypothetical protein